ncbi:MAG: HAMP domain-containing protein [Rhodocyclales bacterium]|nr:HAMP domain-containing protein [Rhodocyclales bacterium]
MRLIPRTLLWRTFLLVAALMLLSMLAWIAIFNNYEREPRARQLSQMIVSIANLTRAALVTARPEARLALLRELSVREGIHVYPAEPGDKIAPLPDRPVLKRVESLVREKLGPHTQLTLRRGNEHALFVSFRIDDSDDGDYWLALPRERVDRFIPSEWIGWGIAALLLSLLGAWLIVSRLGKPLKTLAAVAGEIGRGRTPPPVPEQGPAEIETLARAFNQMNTDLARLDQDRALLLAGISHDLRTPLTRLRMGIEMSGMDASLRSESIADIEEMDRSIGQFLDFARTDGSEASRDTDLAALLAEIVDQYRRRDADVALGDAPPLSVPVRPQALRRAIANLIENALRHADSHVELSLHATAQEILIDVADRGPGIPPAEVERLKLPFTRLEQARTGAIGTGLGLAIVDRIARGHGGRLALIAREGGGLLARIALPMTS